MKRAEKIYLLVQQQRRVEQEEVTAQFIILLIEYTLLVRPTNHEITYRHRHFLLLNICLRKTKHYIIRTFITVIQLIEM